MLQCGVGIPSRLWEPQNTSQGEVRESGGGTLINQMTLLKKVIEQNGFIGRERF